MNCPKCNNTGWYAYDHNHSKICEVCCTHSDGWWKLEEPFKVTFELTVLEDPSQHYGDKNGKYACKTGCGVVKAYEDLYEEQIVNVTVYRF